MSKDSNEVNDDEPILTGRIRPRQIPSNWEGEPLPEGRGWHWFDADERGNSVRIYRGDPTSKPGTDQNTFVVVTVKGELIDAQGNLTGEFLHD